MLVSIYYKPSSFNGYTMILIVHIFMNLNTLYLNQYHSGEVMLNVLRCQLTYKGQAVSNAEAWFNIALRPRKPEGSLGRTAQDGHLDSHTAPEL